MKDNNEQVLMNGRVSGCESLLRDGKTERPVEKMGERITLGGALNVHSGNREACSSM